MLQGSKSPRLDARGPGLNRKGSLLDESGLGLDEALDWTEETVSWREEVLGWTEQTQGTRPVGAKWQVTKLWRKSLNGSGPRLARRDLKKPKVRGGHKLDIRSPSLEGRGPMMVLRGLRLDVRSPRLDKRGLGVDEVPGWTE